MKAPCLVIVVVALVLSCATTPPDQQPIVGKWSGRDSAGELAMLVFNPNKSAEVIFDNGLLSTADISGGSMRWSLDTEQDPMPLDIALLVGGQEVYRLKMIARFVDSQTMDIRFDLAGDGTNRPKKFHEAGGFGQIRLTRQ